MKQVKKHTTGLSLPELTEKLQKKDKHYSNISKRLQIFYWILIPIYLTLIIIHIFENSPVADIIGSGFFLLGMLTFALLFRNYYKTYKSVDYAQPTLVMLKKAADRYKPFQTKALWALLGIAFIDAGLAFGSRFDLHDMWRVQAIFWGSVLIAMAIGLIVWKINYKPLRDAALSLIKELEDEE